MFGIHDGQVCCIWCSNDSYSKTVRGLWNDCKTTDMMLSIQNHISREWHHTLSNIRSQTLMKLIDRLKRRGTLHFQRLCMKEDCLQGNEISLKNEKDRRREWMPWTQTLHSNWTCLNVELVSYVFKWLSIDIDEPCVTARVYTMPTRTLCIRLSDLKSFIQVQQGHGKN